MTEATDPRRWMRQAESDFRTAAINAAGRSFEWACFCCQQSSEKALKAVLYDQGRSTLVTTQSVVDLVRACQRVDRSFNAIAAAAKELDKHYAQSRYSDAINGSDVPAERYDAEDYKQCRVFAESILTACRNWLGGSSDSSTN